MIKCTAIPCPGPGWIENEGTAPQRAKRVRVVLETGQEPKYDSAWNAMAPPGWAVETTRWSRTTCPFTVAWFLPLDDRG